MAIVNISRTLGYTPENGVRYTYTVDNSTEYADTSLPNNTYFLDKSLGIVLFKDGSGNIRELYPAGLGFTAENVANKSNDAALGGVTPSTTLYPTQSAVKTYADSILGNANALVYKGVIDCSTNPPYPAANAGELYIANGAGKIGGASGITVEVGDMIICNTDGTASGNQATVGNNWNIIEKNIVGAVSGPASSTNNNVAFFDGTTGKLIKDSGITLSGTNTGDETNSSIISKLGFTPEDVANKQSNLTASATKYPTVDAVNTGLNAKQNTVALTTSGTSGAATFNPTTGALNIPTYGGSGGSGFGYTVVFGFSVTTLAASTTYIAATFVGSAAITLASDRPSRRLKAPKQGSIVSVSVIAQLQTNTYASPVSSVMNITVHNLTPPLLGQATIDANFPIGSSITWSGGSFPARNQLYTLSSPLPVNAGDDIQIRFTTPAWTGAPADLSMNFILFIE